MNDEFVKIEAASAQRPVSSYSTPVVSFTPKLVFLIQLKKVIVSQPRGGLAHGGSTFKLRYEDLKPQYLEA